MKKQFVILFILASMLVTPLAAFAQNEETVVENTDVVEITEEGRPRPIRSELFQAKKDFTEIKNEIKAKRMAAMEEMKTAREEFKLKLQSISDMRKKNTVERIDTRLNNANQRHTDRMTENLEKLSSIFERISSKAAALKTEGKDTAAVDSAIANAQTEIDAAQAAVTTQAGKEYVITITDETVLGQAISPVVTQFRNDIKATHQTLVTARLAVIEAAKALKAVNQPVTTPTPAI